MDQGPERGSDFLERRDSRLPPLLARSLPYSHLP